MKPFTKGALISALWWVPAGMVLMLVLQVALFSLLGMLMASGNLPDWFPAPGLKEVRLPALDALPDHGQFDYDWSIKTLDKEEIPMEEFRGKTILLNQWATWCMPCVMEMPSIDGLYRSIDNDNVVFVLVSSEPWGVVREFLDGKDWAFPVYVIEDDVPDGLYNETIPFTVIADPTGTIRFKHDGAADYDTDPARTFLAALAGGDSI